MCMEEDGTYFVAMCLDLDDWDFEKQIFPVSFHTKDYKKALILVNCIIGGDPRKRLMFADTDSLFYFNQRGPNYDDYNDYD